MRCPRCETANLPDARFCESCGTSLSSICSACGEENRPGAKFCRTCGSSLTGQSVPPASATTSRPARRTATPDSYTPRYLAEKILQSRSALEGERKQVTVMFADVKGSMSLSEQVDPEEWHRILDRFFAILTEGVHRFEGTVNQYTGDGIMALFGAPIAHEDHAQRACYAALRLTEKLKAYADELRRSEGLSFLVRIGIHSGDVVVGKIGDDLRMDYTAQGLTVGLAARMEQLAEPGRPLLTESTAQLVGGYFRLRDLGEANVKGVSTPLRLFELEDIGSTRTRFDASRARGLAHFVGRDDEMKILESALDRTLQGGGRIVSIVADAGTGKSRLCYEFSQQARARGVEVNEAVCLAHGRTIPFLPLVDHFRQSFGIRSQDRPEVVRQKVAGALTLLDSSLQETLPLWFEFFGVADPTRPLSRMDPDMRQRKFVGAIRRFIRARSKAAPLVLIFEDLQWADSASETLLQNLVEVLPESRTLLVLNYRPEYRAAWTQLVLDHPKDPADAFYRIIPLTPLGAPAVHELLDELIGTDPSLNDLRQLVQEHTAGNPFFIEELVRSLFADGILVNQAAKGSRVKARLTRPITEIHIPASVRGVIAARIDRLSPQEKEVLQTAAVIGKEFSEPILEHVLKENGFGGDLNATLSHLVASELLLEKSLYPEAEFSFHHPITHHVAYFAQLRDRRARIHAAVARALMATDPDEVDVRAGLIAHHWEDAGDRLEAARWSRKAAEWLARSDPNQAQQHWRKVGDLVGALPSSEERDHLLMHASTQLIALGVRLGITIDEASAILERARAVGEARNDALHLAQLHNAYGMFAGMAGLGDTALEHILEAERYAVSIGDREVQLTLRVSLAVWLLHRGQLRDALELIEQGIKLADGDIELGADMLGFSPLIFLTLYRGTTKATQGDLDAARTDIATALTLARRHDEPELECIAMGFRTVVVCVEGDLNEVLVLAQQTLQLANRLGSPFMLGFANGILGMAHRMREEWDAAAAVIATDLTITRERQTGLLVEAVSIANLAEVYLGKGELAKAMATADEAIAVARQRGSRVFECDALFAKIDVLLRMYGSAAREEIELVEAEAAEIIETTGARSRLPMLWERRAALAQVEDDTRGYVAALKQAKQVYATMGARGHVARLARLLAPYEDVAEEEIPVSAV